MPVFGKVVVPKTVPNEISNIYTRKRMDFGSNSVVTKSPNFMDLSLSPANTTDKLKSIISPATRVERLTNGSNWLASRHDIEEVRVERVGEAKFYSNYNFKNKFGTMKFFERENISVT